AHRPLTPGPVPCLPPRSDNPARNNRSESRELEKRASQTSSPPQSKAGQLQNVPWFEDPRVLNLVVRGYIAPHCRVAVVSERDPTKRIAAFHHILLVDIGRVLLDLFHLDFDRP